MISLTFDLGAGFVAGLALSAMLLLLATFPAERRNVFAARDRTSALRRAVVNALAAFLADVVEHPAFVDAASRTVATAVNRWIADPASRRALRVAYEEIPKTQVVGKVGRDAADAAKSFGRGVVETVRENHSNLRRRHDEGISSEEVGNVIAEGNSDSDDELRAVYEEGPKATGIAGTVGAAKSFGRGVVETVRENRRRIAGSNAVGEEEGAAKKRA